MESSHHPCGPEGPAVLLCEGDRDLRLVLTALLEADGWTVLAAGDAREAVSRAIGSGPRCIALSLPLPGGDPEEILRGLRGLAGMADVPVVAIAPPDLALPTGSGFEAGRDVRLSKTFGPRDLLAAVRRTVPVAVG
jgi:two-component system, OmpR family, response regulator